MTSPPPVPVVLIHGLWLHASSWHDWAERLDSLGYAPTTPGWPGESATATGCRDNPEPIANRGVGEVTQHFADLISSLPSPPIVIGHSVGGLVAERLLGMGLVRGAVGIAPVQFRGVRRLPLVQLRTALPFLSHPGNRDKAVSQSADSFFHGFANGVCRTESDALWEAYAIPAPALPLFEVSSANVSVHTDATVDTHRERGPLLLVAGGADRTVPEATVRSAFNRYRHNPSITRFKVFAGRSHSQPVDSGWREVADYTLDFLEQHGLGPEADST